MPKGAKPGRRQGGRKRGTPNRATKLGERILALAVAHPSLPIRKFLGALTRDQELPADIRMVLLEYSQLTVKGRKSALRVPEALLQIAQDQGAPLKQRKSAASQIANHFLPEKPANPRWRYKKGQYEFFYNQKTAKEYRDLRLQLHEWQRTGSKLPEGEVNAMNKRLREIQPLFARRPAPFELYGDKQILEDRARLEFLVAKHEKGLPLTKAEDEEEIERWARHGSVEYGPQQIARNRRAVLEDEERRIKHAHLRQESSPSSLTHEDEAELMYLRTFFPKRHELLATPRPPEDPEIRDARLAEDHPFQTETPNSDGCFRVITERTAQRGQSSP
jgi:hypothetical protein